MFPKRFTVKYLPCIGVTQNGMGNDVPVHGPAEERKVYGWSEHRNEKLDAYTSRDIAEIDLALPPCPINLMDQFVLDPADPGRPFEVMKVRDRTRGFHGWRPGIVVELKRVTG